MGYILPFAAATFACCSLALHALTDAGESMRWLIMSLVSGLVLTYSIASGFLIWPVLLLQAIALRLSRHILTGISALTIVTAALQALDVSPEKTQLLSRALANPGQCVRFFIALFGTSWAPLLDRPGTAATILALVCVACLMAGALVLRRRIYSRQAGLSFLSGFMVLNAVMTALGRWEEGLAPRYYLPILVFWCALGLVAFSVATRLIRQWGVIVFGLGSIFFFFFYARTAPDLEQEAKIAGEKYRLAQAALASGVASGDALRYLTIPVELTFAETHRLSTEHYSLYSTPPTSWLGDSVAQHFRVVDRPCAGEVRSQTWVPADTWAGLALSGWLPAQESGEGPFWVLVADENQKIVGFGADSGLVEMSAYRSHRNRAWKAFVPEKAATGSLFVYRALDSRTVCAVNPARPIIPSREIPAFDISEHPDLVPIWRPDPNTISADQATLSFSEGAVFVKSTGTDAKLIIKASLDLNDFDTIVFKVKFQRRDTVEIFFGQQSNGRGIEGSVPLPGRWVYVFAQVGRNPFWHREAGGTFRFDPTGNDGKGSVTEISGAWASRQPIGEGSDMFVFALAKQQVP